MVSEYTNRRTHGTFEDSADGFPGCDRLFARAMPNSDESTYGEGYCE
jgi:hypothetical protein